MDDLYLSAMIGAVEMVTKGVTACYEMFFEFPSPTLEGWKRSRAPTPMSACGP